MITEKGKLVVGLPDPKTVELFHKEFEIGPMMVKASIDAEAYAAGKTEHHRVLYEIASQILRLGELRIVDGSLGEFTDFLAENLAEIDLIELADARARLEKKLDSYRAKNSGESDN